MSDARQTLREEARFRILRLLEENPQMSQRELAAAAGVGLGSVNYCLAALVEKGLVKLNNFSQAPDKRRYSYNLTPKGITEKTRLTNRFLRQKLAEFDALKAEIADLRREVEEVAKEHTGSSKQNKINASNISKSNQHSPQK